MKKTRSSLKNIKKPSPYNIFKSKNYKNRNIKNTIITEEVKQGEVNLESLEDEDEDEDEKNIITFDQLVRKSLDDRKRESLLFKYGDNFRQLKNIFIDDPYTKGIRSFEFLLNEFRNKSNTNRSKSSLNSFSNINSNNINSNYTVTDNTNTVTDNNNNNTDNTDNTDNIDNVDNNDNSNNSDNDTDTTDTDTTDKDIETFIVDNIIFKSKHDSENDNKSIESEDEEILSISPFNVDKLRKEIKDDYINTINNNPEISIVDSQDLYKTLSIFDKVLI